MGQSVGGWVNVPNERVLGREPSVKLFWETFPLFSPIIHITRDQKGITAHPLVHLTPPSPPLALTLGSILFSLEPSSIRG